jgi:hypothetical protein
VTVERVGDTDVSRRPITPNRRFAVVDEADYYLFTSV